MGAAHILDLPNEVLTVIVDYLDIFSISRLIRTCRRMDQFGYKLEDVTLAEGMSNRMIKVFIKNAKDHIKKLTIKGANIFQICGLPNLEYLDISESSVYKLMDLPKLEKLIIRQMQIMHMKIDKQILESPNEIVQYSPCQVKRYRKIAKEIAEDGWNLHRLSGVFYTYEDVCNALIMTCYKYEHIDMVDFFMCEYKSELEECWLDVRFNTMILHNITDVAFELLLCLYENDVSLDDVTISQEETKYAALIRQLKIIDDVNEMMNLTYGRKCNRSEVVEILRYIDESGKYLPKNAGWVYGTDEQVDNKTMLMSMLWP